MRGIALVSGVVLRALLLFGAIAALAALAAKEART